MTRVLFLSHAFMVGGAEEMVLNLVRHLPPRFEPVVCKTLADFETFFGHEIAWTIKASRDAGEKLILILPVGPMGMYRWVVYFLSQWNVSCEHVHGFNMDEWSDAAGRSLPSSHPGSFEHAMEGAAGRHQ